MSGPVTALGMGLAACATCGLLARLPIPCPPGAAVCPRCASALHARKPDSLRRTSALLAAATILMLPANLLPIMHTEGLGGVQSDTILSGVLYLWQAGAWPLSLIVFVASIAVPVGKLAVLAALVVSVRRPGRWPARARARWYRLLELVGRWSMLDIFVVALLVALVQLQALATVEAGLGAVAFGGVVVLTLLATHAFDPRLLWDREGSPR